MARSGRVHESADGGIRPCKASSPETCRAKGPGDMPARHFDSQEEYEQVLAAENSSVPMSATRKPREQKQRRKTSVTPDMFAGMTLPELSHDDTFPRPQANRASRIAAVVTAIHAGANDTHSLKIALNEAGDRDARYYADAAGYLGLVESTGPGEFQVTEAGAYLALSPDEAGRITAERIKGTPEFQSFVTGREDGVRTVMTEETGLGDVTIERRVATAVAWAEFVAESETSGGQATRADLEDMRTRLEAAKADRARRLEEAKKKAEAAAPKFCDRHFIQLAANGSCAMCE